MTQALLSLQGELLLEPAEASGSVPLGNLVVLEEGLRLEREMEGKYQECDILRRAETWMA